MGMYLGYGMVFLAAAAAAKPSYSPGRSDSFDLNFI